MSGWYSEALYEDDAFPERELAALVAAKVYYQLQEYNESMIFALGAGKLFDIHHAGEFEETILGKFGLELYDVVPVATGKVKCIGIPAMDDYEANDTFSQVY